jgi:hypothetical protein
LGISKNYRFDGLEGRCAPSRHKILIFKIKGVKIMKKIIFRGLVFLGLNKGFFAQEQIKEVL